MALLQSLNQAVLDRIGPYTLGPLSNKVLQPLVDNQQFSFLQDKRVCLYCDTIQTGITITFMGERLVMVPSNTEWNTKISADLETFLKLINQQTDPDTLFFQRHIRVEGNTALGLQCKNVLDQLDAESIPLLLRYVFSKSLLCIEKGKQLLNRKAAV